MNSLIEAPLASPTHGAGMRSGAQARNRRVGCNDGDAVTMTKEPRRRGGETMARPWRVERKQSAGVSRLNTRYAASGSAPDGTSSKGNRILMVVPLGACFDGTIVPPS